MTQTEALISENESLKNMVYNLTIYMQYLEEFVVEPDKWKEFENHFSGLPAYGKVDAEK